jgi:hypothetical protein
MTAPESPAALLRRAASAMRERAGADPAASWHLAVAELLASAAREAVGARERGGEWHLDYCDNPEGIQAALKVARAFLSEPEGAHS